MPHPRQSKRPFWLKLVYRTGVGLGLVFLTFAASMTACDLLTCGEHTVSAESPDGQWVAFKTSRWCAEFLDAQSWIHVSLKRKNASRWRRSTYVFSVNGEADAETAWGSDGSLNITFEYGFVPSFSLRKLDGVIIKYHIRSWPQPGHSWPHDDSPFGQWVKDNVEGH